MPSSELGFVYAFARPVDADADLLEKAAHGSELQAVLGSLRVAGNEAALPGVEPGLGRSPLSWFRRGAEGWELRREELPSRLGRLVEIHVDRNGHCHLFCDRAAEVFTQQSGRDRRVIFEKVILGCLASLVCVGW